MINLTYLTIFITEFHEKLVEKLAKNIQLSLSHLSLLGRYVTLPTMCHIVCHTEAPLWSVREIASMALPAEREGHTENV